MHIVFSCIDKHEEFTRQAIMYIRLTAQSLNRQPHAHTAEKYRAMIGFTAKRTKSPVLLFLTVVTHYIDSAVKYNIEALMF